MVSREKRIIRNLKEKYSPESKLEIGTEMYIPNHSGIGVHPEAKDIFCRKAEDENISGDWDFSAGNDIRVPSIIRAAGLAI